MQAKAYECAAIDTKFKYLEELTDEIAVAKRPRLGDVQMGARRVRKAELVLVKDEAAVGLFGECRGGASVPDLPGSTQLRLPVGWEGLG